MTKKVIFISDFVQIPDSQKKFGVAHPIASFRYRAYHPADFLKKKGLNVLFGFNAKEQDLNNYKKNIDQNSILIFSKPKSAINLEIAKIAKDNHAKIIVDWSDNVLFDDIEKDKNNAINTLRQITNLTDQTTVCSQTLADGFLKEMNITATVIGDPIEYNRVEPRFTPQGPIKLFWYGFSRNVQALNIFLKYLFVEIERYPDLFRVRMAKDRMEGDENVVKTLNAKFDNKFHLELNFWTKQVMLDGFGWTDFVVLPSMRDKFFATKSTNRLVETIQNGRFALAHPVPSYLELKDFCFVGDDLLTGMDWALANPKQAIEKIRAGQDYIAKHFSLDVIGPKWLDVIEKLS